MDTSDLNKELCNGCKQYTHFNVVARPGGEKVQCQKCGHESEVGDHHKIAEASAEVARARAAEEEKAEVAEAVEEAKDPAAIGKI